MSGDDYLLVTQAGDVAGRFSFGDWLGFLAHEWGEVNGRTSDSLLRAVLRPGPWFYPLFAPLMLTATGLAVGAWLAATRPRGDRAWLYPAGLLVVPFLLWLNPSFSGDAVFWTAGAMNYVLPLGAAAAGLAGTVRILGGDDLPWRWVVLTAVGLALTDSLHEIVSGALAAVAFVVIVTARGRLPIKAWVLAGTSLVAFAAHMCAPGLWMRSGRVADKAGAGSVVEQLIHSVAVSFNVLWGRTAWIWLGLVAVLVWLGATARRRGLVLSATAVGVGVLGLVSSAYTHRAPVGDDTGQVLPPETVPFATLLLAVLPVVFLAVWVALAHERERLGWVPVMAWAGFIGSNVFVLGSGASGDRVHFLPTALLLVTVLSLASALTRELAGRARTGLVGVTWALLGLPAAVWADSAWVGLQANQRFVETEIIQPLKAAAPGSEVVVPNNLPAPLMSYGFAFLMPRYEEAMKIYHDLPRDLHVTNP
jgi:membrane protein